MKTKIVGYLIVAGALLNTVVDMLNGGGFDISNHLSEILTALNGAGLVFLRDAIAKITK